MKEVGGEVEELIRLVEEGMADRQGGKEGGKGKTGEWEEK